MPDSTDMLLNSILSQIAQVTQRIEFLNSKVVNRDSLDDFEGAIDRRISAVEKRLDSNFQDLLNMGKLIGNQDTRINTNTAFISGISSSGKWFIRVVLVALLGVVTSIVPSYIANLNKPQIVAPSVSTPLVAPSAKFIR